MPIVQMIEPRRGPTTSILAFSRRASSAAGQCRAGAEGRWQGQRAEKTTGKQTRQMEARARAPPNGEGHERKQASCGKENTALLIWS